MINPKAIKAISTVTGLDSDLSEFIIEEIEQSEFKIDSIDEDKMAEIIGEHLVKYVFFCFFTLSFLKNY